MYYYITTEFDHAKHDSRLAVYGGVVLQRFEFIKVCMGMQGLRLKSQLFLYFVNKIEEEMLKFHVSSLATRFRPQRLRNDTFISRLLRSQMRKQPRHKS